MKSQLMIESQVFLVVSFFIALSNVSIFVNGRFFEYELPNRSITICPSYSLISIECPQISSSFDNPTTLWQVNLPKYFISIDYIRSYPLRLGFDPRSCQPDQSHVCNNYDLRYINSLCNGKSHCSDISTYQIRERSLCAFKAVTEIGFHCVPTWNLHEIENKYDICENISISNNYGFIYSRNYPLKTIRMSCFIQLSAKLNEKLILYFVNGDLNHDQLRIESIRSDHQTIVNITLNGNLTTHRITQSDYQIKISFLPSEIYSYHPTFYLLYFYTIPICSTTEPCLSTHKIPLTTPPIFPTTSRIRIQSIGWTKVQNIWIIIPIILAYILLLFIIIILALLLQRRRKQKKLLEDLRKSPSANLYFDRNAATPSRTQLVPPMTNPNMSPHFYNYQGNLPSSTNNSFSQNFDRYSRSSRSDFDLHGGFDAHHHPSIPYRIHSTTSNENLSQSNSINRQFHRSLPKSFSDCDLCKKRVINEELQQYPFNRNSIETKSFQDNPKQRSSIRQIPNNETSTNVEYSTVLPRHQRISSDSNRSVRHLPFEYIPNDHTNLNEDFSVKYFNNHHPEYSHDPREIQRVSMKINDKHQYYHQ